MFVVPCLWQMIRHGCIFVLSSLPLSAWMYECESLFTEWQHDMTLQWHPLLWVEVVSRSVSRALRR